MSSTKWCVLLSAVAVCVAVGVAGCTPKPPATAVLAGTWTLTEGTSPDPNLTSTQLNFDSNGNLVSVTYVFNNATATKTLNNTSTSVSGTAVTVASTTAGFTLAFDGTLNADSTEIDGTASFTLVILNTTITAPVGPAKLVKGALTGNAAAGETLWNAECAGCHNGTIAPTAANTDPALVVTNLSSINAAMNVTLTNQEVLDVKAFLATQ